MPMSSLHTRNQTARRTHPMSWTHMKLPLRLWKSVMGYNIWGGLLEWTVLGNMRMQGLPLRIVWGYSIIGERFSLGTSISSHRRRMFVFSSRICWLEREALLLMQSSPTRGTRECQGHGSSTFELFVIAIPSLEKASLTLSFE